MARRVNTEKYINKYIHTYIHKANHFNTGPTTSSRHSNKYIKPTISILGLLQVVGTVIKNIKLQPVPPLMPSESLSVRLTWINSASNGINGVTGCNFIFFWYQIQLHRPICRLCCEFFSYDSRKHIIKIRISLIGTYRTMGHRTLVGPYEMIIMFELP